MKYADMVGLPATPTGWVTGGESVVYVGTHDMDTALGWWRKLPSRSGARPACPASIRAGS